ncbi:MAG: CaiB/BaiF CoA-transferase family protein [Microbacteriaceae bacterium]
MSDAHGPLADVKVVELQGVGPGPFGGMLLADYGADVVRIDRPGGSSAGRDPVSDVLARGRRSVAVDLKRPEGVEVVLRIVEGADALIEPFRPGVAERLGLGPDTCLERNPRLVYCRMTGWGQDGPYRDRAGHDINYLSLNGILHMIGTKGGPPVPPLNLVGDFGGGGMLLALGLVCGIVHARATGEGQVVDVAMQDGSALLTAMIHQMRAFGGWAPERGTNVLDGGAPYYGVYETSDGGYMSVGPIEPQFYKELVEGLGLVDDPVVQGARDDRERWPALHDRFAEVFRSRTRDEWAAVFAGKDACATPVLSLDEAMHEPQVAERGTYVEEFGVVQPAPAPRFSATPAAITTPAPAAGKHSRAVLADFGFDDKEIASLLGSGAVFDG